MGRRSKVQVVYRRRKEERGCEEERCVWGLRAKEWEGRRLTPKHHTHLSTHTHMQTQLIHITRAHACVAGVECLVYRSVCLFVCLSVCPPVFGCLHVRDTSKGSFIHLTGR